MVKLLTVLGLVFIGIVFALLLKKDKPELTIFLILFLCIFIALHILALFQTILEEVSVFGSYLEEYAGFLKLLVKMIGLTYLSELAAGICKDYGYSSIGNQIEILGKMLIIVIGLPILRTIMELLEGVLK